ncbi:hypothetical protein H9K76_05175 [Diaphorobacter ruginosibacter]|uniref:Uncharacterized protein n=1 Tax=Diaphorobacter ruginosibacter TaxID=1715720 RepID=A0A7G9RRM0_9BURK|nr:hypothetical protein [Diaphorobacter ruginosibacter]QNN58245.1 hypothetical protein H9K76_05175 [Diaphorobacter ruginosibacter]
MADEERKAELKFGVDGTEVQAGLDQINRGVKDMAQSVARAGETAAKGISSMGDGADKAAQKVAGSQRKISEGIKRTSDDMEAGARAAQRSMERQTAALASGTASVGKYNAAYYQSLSAIRGWGEPKAWELGSARPHH